MKKHILSLILTVCLMLAVATAPAYASEIATEAETENVPVLTEDAELESGSELDAEDEPENESDETQSLEHSAMSLSNFGTVRVYQNDFADVSQDAWYYVSVKGVFERGILDGKGDGLFDPNGRITIAETIKIAAVLHSLYHTGEIDFEPAAPWYAPYREYCLANDIPVGVYRNLNAWATRSDFAAIIAGALPEEALTPMNTIQDGGIPDVAEGFSYGTAVYRLYRAGVLTGSDELRRFFPGRTISRAEASTLISRVTSADERVSFFLAPELTAEQVYDLASPAVFFIELYDDEGVRFRNGSGFFITETGLGVTNYHVVIGASSAKITTDDGTVYDVTGIYDYNRKQDLALIQIDGEGFPRLEFAEDSSHIRTGATVYTLGSPLGLQATFSKGIISQADREVEGLTFIQIDAPISSGSSGGALLDSYGRIIGVTNSTLQSTQVAQNLNLAIPINLLDQMNREELVSFESLFVDITAYEGHPAVPDFGAHFGVSPVRAEQTIVGMTYSYRIRDLRGDFDAILDEYMHLTEQKHFYYFGTMTSRGVEYTMYHNFRYNVFISIGYEEIGGADCITIAIS